MRDSDEQAGGPGPASGVHRRPRGRVLVIDPDRGERARWTCAFGTAVEFLSAPATLPRALRAPGQTEAVALALVDRLQRAERAEIARSLGEADIAMRVVVELRRCDLATAMALMVRGYCVVAGGGPEAVADGRPMSKMLGDVRTRRPLVRTLAATHVADTHGLTPAEFRVVRALLVHHGVGAIGRREPMAESTARGHLAKIRRKVGGDTAAVLTLAREAAEDCAYQLGRLRL